MLKQKLSKIEHVLQITSEREKSLEETCSRMETTIEDLRLENQKLVSQASQWEQISFKKEKETQRYSFTRFLFFKTKTNFGIEYYKNCLKKMLTEWI